MKKLVTHFSYCHRSMGKGFVCVWHTAAVYTFNTICMFLIYKSVNQNDMWYNCVKQMTERGQTRLMYKLYDLNI